MDAESAYSNLPQGQNLHPRRRIEMHFCNDQLEIAKDGKLAVFLCGGVTSSCENVHRL
jgi:hypothetical protein